MTLSWALYVLLVSLALGWAAAAAESVLRLYDGQARIVWVGAMLLSVVLPAVGLLTPGLQALLAYDGGTGAPLWAVPAVPQIMGTVQGAADSGRSVVRWAETGFFVAWLVGSGWLLLRLAASVRSVRRRKRRWTSLQEAGGTVYRDEELGPAAVGVLRPEVVLPGWALELDDAEREMVVLHEQEHARTRDPALIAGGWTLLALVPWNLPLWWQFRRLRRSVELDCDLRVVRRTRTPRRYGRLLLRAARHAKEGSVPVVAGGESFVGSRIRSLVADAPTFRPLRTVSGLTGVVCATVLAATLPSPEEAAVWSRQAVFDRLGEDGHRVSNEALSIANPAEVRTALERAFPEELRRRGVTADVNVMVHVRPDGTVGQALVQQPTAHPRLDRAARRVALGIEFEPPEEADEGSGVWLVQPLRFRAD